MASIDKRVTELNLHTSLTLSDVIPIVSGGETKKTTYGSLYYGIRDGVVSGSEQISFNGITDKPTLVSGSSQLTSSYDIIYVNASETSSMAVSSSLYAITASYAVSTSFAVTSSLSETTLRTIVYVKNVSGTQIDKGKVVRISGATGDNPLIVIASFLTEGQSANTLGITTQNIPNDDFGYVITEGVLLGVNTDGMSAGQLLYLGVNGSFTTTPPTAPNHGVRLGEVLREQQNNGSIYVRVDNGSELGEAHDVVDTSTSSSYGDILMKSGSVWVNTKTLISDYTISGSLFISGATEFGGNLVPKVARGATLGTIDRPFREIFLQSGSISIESDIIGEPSALISNKNGNLEISVGGMLLVQSGSSFIAPSGSFSHLSGSYTQTGSVIRNGNTTLTGSLNITGSFQSDLQQNYLWMGDSNNRSNPVSLNFLASSITGSSLVTASLQYQTLTFTKGNGSTFNITLTEPTSSIFITGSISTVDYIDFNTNIPYTLAEGRLGWDSGEGTLQLGMDGGNVTYSLGEQVMNLVYNSETSSLTKGQVVYISGSQGNRISVKLADNSGDPRSAGTLGFVAETITAGGTGWVVTDGPLRKLNTIGLTPGNPLYLGSTPGTYTQTKPQAPRHEVRLGYVERVHATVGSIFVKINNGYLFEELHDVLVNTGSLKDSATNNGGSTIYRSGSLWVNNDNVRLAQSTMILASVSSSYNFADDTAAALGGIPLGGLYHTSGSVKIRLT